MVESAARPRRRRWWRRRHGLPRSRQAFALGALVAVLILVLLLLGLTRARPGRDVPFYDPSITATTAARGTVAPPSITAGATVPTQPPSTAVTTTRRRR